jgi:hypothetical protein
MQVNKYQNNNKCVEFSINRIFIKIFKLESSIYQYTIENKDVLYAQTIMRNSGENF